MSDKETLEYEVKGSIVAYDLPSENHDCFKGRENEPKEDVRKRLTLKNRVMSGRIKATTKLYTLGLPSTQSVLLVAQRQVDRVEKIINEVREIYTEINDALKAEDYPKIGMPYIRTVPIVQTQFVTFRELAERQLKEKLEKQIDTFSVTMTKLGDMADEEKRKAMKYRLSGQERELRRLELLAREIGVDVEDNATLLSSMIAQAIEELK